MNPIRKILIADDHPIFRKGLCEVIAADPSLVVVHEASDGEQALRSIEEQHPEVAILDITMPKLNGLQVARALWQAKSPVKTILLTMHEDENLFDEAMEAGVSAYVLKENAVEDLLTAVHAVLAGRRFVSASIAGLLARRREQSALLRREKPGLDLITPTERRVLRLIAEDRTTKEIADLLGISPRTVESHRQNMSHKLHLSGSHSLLKFAFDNKAQL